MVRSHIPSFTVIKGKGDWFWGGSIYQGIKYLKLHHIDPDDYVLICNDDIMFDSEFLEKGVKALENSNNAMIIVSCYSQQTGRFLESGIHADWRSLKFGVSNDPEQINCASTMGLFVTVRHLLRIGDTHPKLIPHYLSDYEFTMRAYSKGLRLVPEPSLKIMINEATTRNVANREIRLINYFSKKSPEYIISWTFFILLMCPVRYRLLNLARIWYQLLKATYREVNRICYSDK